MKTKVLMIFLNFLIVSCASVEFSAQSNPNQAQTDMAIKQEQTLNTFLFGFIQSTDDLAPALLCPKYSRINWFKLEPNQVVSFITAGLYIPVHMTWTCSKS